MYLEIRDSKLNPVFPFTQYILVPNYLLIVYKAAKIIINDTFSQTYIC